MANSYIIMICNIQFPVKSYDDQSFSEDIFERKAIIAWDIQDINRVIPLYIQQDDEVRNNAPLPEIIWFYTSWALCSTKLTLDSQLNDTSLRYFIYDLKRESYYSFGSIYTVSHAYIQHATEDYAQVIILHLNPADMIVRDESATMAGGKSVGIRVHWHSYIFDTKHSTGLEDHSGEIIMPYCDNPTIHGEGYGRGLMLVTIYDAKDPFIRIGGAMPHAMLALVRVPNHSLPQNSISRRRRSRFDETIGKVIWIQPIATDIVLPLYSQNIIVVQQYGKIDILSDTDSKIVRQFDCNIYKPLRPIIGPYCFLVCRNNDNFIINVETGGKFSASCQATASQEALHHNTY
jgi:hypothetical protein